MADPLSVAAGVVGILSSGIKISTTLYNIVRRVKKAPKECQETRAEVDGIGNTLNQLQMFVLGASQATRSRTSLILVDQVVTTLAATVATFSELDLFVETLDGDEKMGLMDKVRWTMRMESLNEILAKLRLHRSSMNLMLTILTWYAVVETYICIRLRTILIAKVLLRPNRKSIHFVHLWSEPSSKTHNWRRDWPQLRVVRQWIKKTPDLPSQRIR